MNFEIRGNLDKKKATLYSTVGVVLFFTLWQLIRVFNLIPHTILPTPLEVISSLKELHFHDYLVRNFLFSIKLNLLGFLVAALVSIPIGFLLGLYAIPRALCSKILDSTRFIPFSAVTGIFIAWFGLGSDMKVYFLAAAIAVYLIPTVAQRVMELDIFIHQTAITMGATKWQLIRDVYIRGVLPKLSDDLRVLVAISWTYIIIAELINAEQGVGRILFYASRNNRIDKMFMAIILIMLWGMFQDWIFKKGDRLIFKHKY